VGKPFGRAGKVHAKDGGILVLAGFITPSRQTIESVFYSPLASFYSQKKWLNVPTTILN